MDFEIIIRSLSKLKDKEKFNNLKKIIEKITSCEIFNETENIKHEKSIQEKPDLVLNFINECCKYGNVPNKDYEQVEISKKDFEDYLSDVVIILQCLLSITKNILQLNQVCFEKKELNNTIIQLLILCGSHDGYNDWTNDLSRKLSEELCECIIQMYTSKDTGNEHSNIYLKLAKSFFISLLPRLLDNKWKENPSLKHVFKWYLLRIKHPHLGELLPEVLPPSLLFVDDYVTDNKIVGVVCLSHIINNVDRTELIWFGRAEVVYSAIEHLLYTHEAELIPVLHPCILQILKVVEGDPVKIIKYNRFDKVFEMIISDMEFEQQLILRRVYPLYLPQFVSAMGITIVRHMKRLVEVIGSYLEVYDGPEEKARKLMLLTLKALILNAWPRIPYHLENILKILLKFMYDMDVDRTTTPSSIKEDVIHLAKECLILLKKTCPEKFKELCCPLVDEGAHLPGISNLKLVLETEECACTFKKIQN